MQTLCQVLSLTTKEIAIDSCPVPLKAVYEPVIEELAELRAFKLIVGAPARSLVLRRFVAEITGESGRTSPQRCNVEDQCPTHHLSKSIGIVPMEAFIATSRPEPPRQCNYCAALQNFARKLLAEGCLDEIEYYFSSSYLNGRSNTIL